MILDALLNFVPIGGNLSMVGGAGVAIPSSSVIDLLGLGVGVAPTERIIGLPASGLFGEDSGLGAIKPQIQVNPGTVAWTTANGATLNIAVQAAPDTAVTNLPGTWQTIDESGPLTLAQINAAITGQYPIYREDWPAAFPPGLNARYMRLLFQLNAAANFTAGSIASAIVTMVRDDWSVKYAARNFSFNPGP